MGKITANATQDDIQSPFERGRRINKSKGHPLVPIRAHVRREVSLVLVLTDH